MTIRSVDEIIDQMRETLVAENSELSTFPDFGNLYTIFRSVAALVTEQDSKIQTLDDTLFLETATGEHLDRKAREFGIERRSGNKASGTVIITGEQTIIPQNTILTHQPTNVQFRVTDRITLTNNRILANIESLRNSSNANLPAGTKLRSSVFPGLQFVVGNNFNIITNQYNGDLRGGTEKESDALLKSRVRSSLRNLAQSTVSALTLEATRVSGVNKATIVENNPAIGYITAYIDNKNQDVIRRVKNALNNVKPIGTAITIKSFEDINIDINMTISLLKGQNNNITTEIRNRINQYFETVEGPTTITKEAIASIVLNNEAVYNITITTPTDSIEIKAFQIPRLNSLNINYVN